MKFFLILGLMESGKKGHFVCMGPNLEILFEVVK